MHIAPSQEAWLASFSGSSHAKMSQGKAVALSLPTFFTPCWWESTSTLMLLLLLLPSFTDTKTYLLWPSDAQWRIVSLQEFSGLHYLIGKVEASSLMHQAATVFSPSPVCSPSPHCVSQTIKSPFILSVLRHGCIHRTIPYQSTSHNLIGHLSSPTSLLRANTTSFACFYTSNANACTYFFNWYSFNGEFRFAVATAGSFL